MLTWIKNLTAVGSLETCHTSPTAFQQTSVPLKWKFMKCKGYTLTDEAVRAKPKNPGLGFHQGWLAAFFFEPDIYWSYELALSGFLLYSVHKCFLLSPHLSDLTDFSRCLLTGSKAVMHCAMVFLSKTTEIDTSGVPSSHSALCPVLSRLYRTLSPWALL